MKTFILCIFICFSTVMAQTFTSNENKTMLIELYSSQGCSSCPPADNWLKNLKNDDNLFKTFIPMAFHVTYWDFLGWKDTFANALHDNRQRYYANRVWKNRAVYTPQFIVNAKEYRQWFQTQAFPNAINEYGGILKITSNKNTLKIQYDSKNKSNEDIYVHVAILGFDYVVDITAGENKNRNLLHDFVVLKHHQHFAQIVNGKLITKQTLPQVQNDNHQKALVVWLSNKEDQIIQAVAGYL